MRRRALIVGLAVAAGLGLGGRDAHAATANACLAKKLGDVGRATALVLGCHARQAGKPDVVARDACLAKAERRFTGGDDPSRGVFAKRERKPPCVTVDDQSAMAADIAAEAAALASAVGDGEVASRCDALKLICLGRYLTGAFNCLGRSAAGTGTIDAACLARQTAKLGGDGTGCLGKAASRGGCGTADDTGLRALAQGFAAQTLCALDPGGSVECTALPTPVPTPTRTATPVASRTPTPRPTAGGGSDDATQLCVDTINQYRGSIGRAPLLRWTEAETCVDGQALADSQTGSPHSAFGQCSEFAQNECPGWYGPPEAMIGNCLAVMWAEGPGQPYSQHGHYINMANPGYTKVACGFAVLSNGAVWAVQDFQ